MMSAFSEWYRPAAIDVDDEILSARWGGVESVYELIDPGFAADLVRVAVGLRPRSKEFNTQFRNAFREHDEQFPEAGNEHEVRVLAACVLAYALTEPANEEVATALSVASACGLRKIDASMDLIAMARHAAGSLATAGRSRTPREAPQVPNGAARVKAVLDQFEASDGSKDAVKQALSGISAAMGSVVGTVQKQYDTETLRLQKLLDIQDEELQFAWWLIGDWSDLWQAHFSKLPLNGRPILMAAEAASMTSTMIEPPAFEAILARVGVAQSELTIPDAVMACGTDRIAALAQEAVDPWLFPIHLAIARANECPGDGSWTTAWTNLTSVAAERKAPASEIACQFLREIKFLKALER